MNDKLSRLLEAGQSIWYDNIDRELLENGTIQALVDEGIRGMTSNPSIFKKAITQGTDYDEQLRALAEEGRLAQDIYEELAVQDIRDAADILRPIFDESGGDDGYISLEVSPLLADNTPATIAEVDRLHEWVDRPNLMVKIPATPEGIPAIAESISRGHNVNVTLIFSLDAYQQVMEAYISGLERRAEAGEPIDQIASVASFFVSRVDTLVDNTLEDIGGDDAQALMGKAAIANAKLAYQLFKETFESERFAALKAKGARVQRPLWASTSTKNPAYRDVLYVEELIGPMTVNTAPPKTIDAFKDHGNVAATLEEGVVEARQTMDKLAAVGVNMEAVTDELLKKGVKSFADSFDGLISAIDEKRQTFAGTPA